MISKIKCGLPIFFISFLISACAGKTLPPSSSGFASWGELRHELVRSLETHNELIQGLRGLATIRYGAKVFGRRGEIAVVLKKPYDLRMDVLSELGPNSVQVSLSRGTLSIYWPGDDRYLKVLAGPDEMARYLSLSLAPESAIRLLAGAIPLGDEKDYILQGRKKGDEYLLRGPTDEVVMSKRGEVYLPVRLTSFDSDGSRNYVVHYSDYTEQDGFWFPRKVSARFWNPGARLEISFHEVDLNPTFTEESFELQIPEHATALSE